MVPYGLLVGSTTSSQDSSTAEVRVEIGDSNDRILARGKRPGKAGRSGIHADFIERMGPPGSRTQTPGFLEKPGV